MCEFISMIMNSLPLFFIFGGNDTHRIICYTSSVLMSIKEVYYVVSYLMSVFLFPDKQGDQSILVRTNTDVIDKLWTTSTSSPTLGIVDTRDTFHVMLIFIVSFSSRKHTIERHTCAECTEIAHVWYCVTCVCVYVCNVRAFVVIIINIINFPNIIWAYVQYQTNSRLK